MRLEDPATVNKLVYALYAACAIVGAADLFINRHSLLSFEAWPGFYAWFGFIGCVGLVLVAKQLRKLLMRDEDYYD